MSCLETFGKGRDGISRGRLPSTNATLPLQAFPNRSLPYCPDAAKTALVEYSRHVWVSALSSPPHSFPQPQPSRTTTHLPGRSGISTVSNTSLPSPSSARSATNLNRPKFILAPLTTTANRLFAPRRLLSRMYCFSPASASAPAGSVIDRVSAALCQLI